MFDPKMLEEFTARLGAAFAASPAADIEKNVRILLSGFFAKLDLVSREEFDIQQQLLLRTRDKLKALESRLDQLENKDSTAN
ncbi:MAG: accessory factor UbiK family protein [Pseudomonadota bacterium]